MDFSDGKQTRREKNTKHPKTKKRKESQKNEAIRQKTGSTKRKAALTTNGPLCHKIKNPHFPLGKIKKQCIKKNLTNIIKRMKKWHQVYIVTILGHLSG